jgi:formylglycine-generating enzyme required for sulfatase activity
MVTQDGAELRDGPGSVYPVVRALGKNTELVAVGRSEGKQWLQVRAPDGQVGWVRAEYLQVNVAVDGLEVVRPPPTPTPRVPYAGATKALGQTGITLVYVPAGEFWMGATDSDPDAWDDEKPRHRVYLDGYWIGQTEVTNAQYEGFILAGGYSTRAFWSSAGWAWRESNGVTQPLYWNDVTWNGAEHPVVGVSWYEAEAYARWAGVRLPTEAQWEYAARGGPLGRGYLYAGSNSVDEVAWYSDNSGGRTHPVGQKKPNELGLYDMSGNVWEWAADWYDAGYYAQSPRENPLGPSTGPYWALRGGVWDGSPKYARCSKRQRPIPFERYWNSGFRVAE